MAWSYIKTSIQNEDKMYLDTNQIYSSLSRYDPISGNLKDFSIVPLDCHEKSVMTEF